MPLNLTDSEPSHFGDAPTEPSVLFNQLLKYDDAYFNAEEIISDAEYDKFKKQLQNLYPANPYFKKVGSPVRTGKEKLPVSMGSLNQLHNDDDIGNWIRKYNIFKKDVVISEKLDGYSCLLEYRDGKLVNAYSRGDGINGASVYRHIKNISNVPSNIYVNDTEYIRGEVILKPHVFQEKYASQYKNPRNFVSGCMNRKLTELSILNDLEFIAHEWIDQTSLKETSLQSLVSNGFLVPKYEVVNVDGTFDHIYLLEKITKFKKESEFELDGVVITINDVFNVENQTSSDSLNPEHSIKYKLDIEESIQTTVKNVIWNLSKNGLLKPQIEFKPTELSGVTITYATGNNAKFIYDNKIGPGADVILIRAGQVIPRLLSVITPSNITKDQMDINIDEILGVDNWEWNESKVDIRVKNAAQHSDVVFKQVLGFFTSLDVEQLKEASLRTVFDVYKIWDKTTDGFTACINVVLDLTESEWSKSIGANGSKIYNSLVRKLQNITLAQIMGSLPYLGIGFGIRRAKLLLDQIPYEKLMDASIGDIIKADGFDIKTAEKVYVGLPKVISFLADHKDQIRFIEKQNTDELRNVTVVLTGFRDKEFQAFLESKGAKVGSGVSKKTTHVIVADKNSESSKASRARELNIPVFSLDEFKDEFSL